MKILDRCEALTAAAYVVLANVGNVTSTSGGPAPNDTISAGQQDIAYQQWLPPARPVKSG